MNPKALEILAPYNPWWGGGSLALLGIPKFRRPLFQTLLEDLERIPQMLSITGPRRVGKTTLVRQLIEALLAQGVPPDRLIYYSFDDPALARKGVDGGELVEELMRGTQGEPQVPPVYLFLDEIHRLDRWELHLKKYYDLKFPVRVVISGSASSPIFKRSRESLVGRVKDYHLLPFSFREFVMYRWQDQPVWLEWTERVHALGKWWEGNVTGDPYAQRPLSPVELPPEVQGLLRDLLNRYFLEGGFPEVWQLPDWVAKQEYLFDNQVKKVIYEDLVLAAEFRKPELLKRFYISLLETPGQEVSVQAVAGKIGINAQQIEKYLPMLEMTDLVHRVERFRKSPLRVRRGRMKFYLVDLALRNAVLRLTESLLEDREMLGLYAENLVFLALRKWRGAIQLDYYRDRDGEVDFVAHVGPRKYLPVEVKYRESIGADDLRSLKSFSGRYATTEWAILVTKRFEDNGLRDNVWWIPLPFFLLMFD